MRMVSAKSVALRVAPKSNLDAIEEAMSGSRGHTVSIAPQSSPLKKAFAGWKLDLIKLICADPRLKPDSIVRVAIAILGHVNQLSFEAFPSQRTIAREAAVSSGTVKKAIRRLEDLGYLTVRKRRRNNLYRFPRNLALISQHADLDD